MADSSKNSSDQLTACCFQLRRGNDNPYWMDYQECCHSLTILYFLCLRIGSYVSTIGSTYLAVALLPVRPTYHGTCKHYAR